MNLREGWQAEAREMVRLQIRPRGVVDAAVLAAMERVPRHLFVPAGLREEAYGDFPLPIGNGQTISQPYMVALMTELLEVGPDAKVLEIGTGSGYQAAVLAEMGARVVSVERIEALALAASQRLDQAGYKATVVTGDGKDGYPAEAPYDRILVTAGAPRVEKAWGDQLDAEGLLVVPVTQSPGMERLLVRRKDPGGNLDRWYEYCRFVPLLPGVILRDKDRERSNQNDRQQGEASS